MLRTDYVVTLEPMAVMMLILAEPCSLITTLEKGSQKRPRNKVTLERYNACNFMTYKRKK